MRMLRIDGRAFGRTAGAACRPARMILTLTAVALLIPASGLLAPSAARAQVEGGPQANALADQVIIQAAQRGWWREDGLRYAGQQIVYIGRESFPSQGSQWDHNSFLTFNLGSLPHTNFNAARLRVYIQGFVGPDHSETIGVYDVSTHPVTLADGGTGQTGIYEDLQSGSLYARFTVIPSMVGTVVDIPLNSRALADIAVAAGSNPSRFSVGLHNESVSGHESDAVRCTLADEIQVLRLVLGNTEAEACDPGTGAPDCNLNGVPDDCETMTCHDLEGVSANYTAANAFVLNVIRWPLRGPSDLERVWEADNAAYSALAEADGISWGTYNPTTSYFRMSAFEFQIAPDPDSVSISSVRLHWVGGVTRGDTVSINLRDYSLEWDDPAAWHEVATDVVTAAPEPLTVDISLAMVQSLGFSGFEELMSPGGHFSFGVANTANANESHVIDYVRLCVTDGNKDCNANGVPDACDISGMTSSDNNANGVPDECDPDCNSNGIPDDLDVAAQTSPDCNMDGIPDECQLAIAEQVILVSPDLPPAFAGNSVFHIFGHAPAALDDVTMTMTSNANLRSSFEYYTLLIDGVVIGELFSSSDPRPDCIERTESITVPQAVWNNAIADDGHVLAEMAASGSVTDICGPESFVRIRAEYDGSRNNDLNANGIPDDCEPPPTATPTASPSPSPVPPSPTGYPSPTPAPCDVEQRLNDFDRGRWDETGFHDPIQQGMMTGRSGGIEGNSFLMFNRDLFSGFAAELALRIEIPALQYYFSSDPSETFGVYDVTTPAGQLLAGGSGLTGVFADLQSGSNYGSFSVTAGLAGGSVLRIPLNEQAVADFNAASGRFSVGLHLESDGGQSTEAVRFSFAGIAYTHQLVITGTDCNGNVILDACDIADMTSADGNLNGVPDECEITPTPGPTPSPSPTPVPCCTGDANNSGSLVDAADFIAVQSNFGADNGFAGLGDADCSGSFVDAADFIAVQNNFGADCG